MNKSLKVRQRQTAPKVYQLADDLGRLAGDIGPGGKLPTVLDLCKQFRVSISTVHGALSELEAQNSIERRHGVGLYVSQKLHCKNICVLLDATLVGSPGAPRSPFWGLLWAQLVAHGQKRSGYVNEEVQYLLVPSGEIPTSVRKGIAAGHIHGCLTIGLHGEPARQLEESGIPTVTYAGDGRYFIANNSDEAISQCVQALVARGCKRVAFWTESLEDVVGEYSKTSYQEYLETISKITKMHGLQSYPNLNRIGVLTQAAMEQADSPVHQNIYAGGYFFDQGFNAAMETFSAPKEEWPDALVISTDTMTHGVFRVLWELGLFPGRDIQIASQTNIGSPILHGWDRELLLWHVDPSEIARAMFDFLDEIMTVEHPLQSERLVRSVASWL